MDNRSIDESDENGCREFVLISLSVVPVERLSVGLWMCIPREREKSRISGEGEGASEKKLRG